MITVYVKPPDMGHCQQCEATTRALIKRGHEFRLEDLYAEKNAHVLELAKAEGISSAPVVIVDRDEEPRIWGGYRPDLINAL